MKTIIERCATYVALSLFILFTFFTSGAHATGAEEVNIPTTEMMTIGKGDTLWSIATKQKLPRQDWSKYWQETCALSKIACTDEAWKKLAVGTVITVPRSVDAILRDKQLHRDSIAAEAIRNDARVSATIHDLSQSKKAMMEKEALLLARFQSILLILSALTLLVMGILLMIVVTKRRASHHPKNEEPTDSSVKDVGEMHKVPTTPTQKTQGPWHPT